MNNLNMHLSFTLNMPSEIRSGLSHTQRINELSNRGHLGAVEGHDIEILSAAVSTVALTLLLPLGDRER